MSTLRSTGIVVLAAMIATMLTLAAAAPPANAQKRADCGDGVGNALGQWRDNTLNRLIGEISDWIQDHPYTPESLNDFYDRCTDGLFPGDPPPGYSDSLPGADPSGRNGSSSGDPHIVTQDGVRYDFHASGDFTLLETLDGSTTLHIRYRGTGPMTVFDGVAGSVDGVRFSLNTFNHGDPADFYIGDDQIELPADGWYDLGVGFVLHFDNTFSIRLDNGIILQAQPSGLAMFTPDSLDGAFVGLHGNGDGDPANDLALRNGDVIDGSDLDAIYGDFFDSWAVMPDDSLFAAPGTIAAPPSERITLADFDEADLYGAAGICADAGLLPGQGLDECIFDVSLTGDPIWAQNVPSAATVPTIPAALLRVAGEPTAVDALTSVTDSFDDWQTKTYAVAASVVERVLRVQPECQPFGAPIATIVIDGRTSAATALTCDTVIPVPSTAFELRIANPSRTQQQFSLTLGEAEVLDLGDVGSGDPLVGSLQPGDRAIGTLDFNRGSRIFLAAGPLADCGVTITITNADGTPVGGARNGCLDHGPITLTGPAPFTLELTSGTSANYDLTITVVADDASVGAAVGSEVALQVATPGQSVSAPLILQAGERVYIETVESIPGNVRMLDPAGAEVQRSISINDLGMFEATQAGEYSIVFEPGASNTGTQLVKIWPVDDDTVVAGTPGDTVDLAINTPGQLAVLTLYLAAGERVYVETVASIDGDLTLTDPSGSQAQSLALNNLGLVQAEVAGVYTITVSGRGAATGTQQLALYDVADDIVGTAEVGDQVEFIIETPGQTSSVLIDLDAGGVVNITNDQTIEATFVIVDPNGDVVFDRLSLLEIGEFTPSTTGTYSIQLTGRGAVTGTQVITITPS